MPCYYCRGRHLWPVYKAAEWWPPRTSAGVTMKAITLLAAAALAAAALISTATAAEVSCNAGFTLIGGSICLKVFLSKVTWANAQAACDAIDIFTAGSAHLAVLDDCSVLPYVWAYVYYQLGLSEDLWIGGSDSDSEGNWEWVNGDPVPTGIPYWHPLQPDGGDLENKLVYAHNGFFADAHDDDLLGYICQYNPI